MQIKFDVFWTKNLGTLYKDNSIDTLGKEAKVSLDLKEVHNIHINFKVNDKSFTDIAHIVDVEVGLIRIPFKTDVIKLGTHELELVATMKNGDVLPSQTYKYTVDKSLENPNAIEADTNYPILIELLQEVGEKISDTEEAINRLDNSIDEMENTINNSLKENTNIINKHIQDSLDNIDNNFNEYVSNADNNLNNKFKVYTNEASLNINTTLDNKCSEVDLIIDNKISEVNQALNETVEVINTTLSNKTNEVDNKVNSKIQEVNQTVNNKVQEVNDLMSNVELSESIRQEQHNSKIEELKSYSNEVSNLKNKVNDHEDRIDALENKDYSDVLYQVNSTLDNHKNRITTNEKYVKTHDVLVNALYNETLDDRITIKEEGTAISLPQSKDGIVKIEELEGNTLVNYCTNGSEELTLNNEINAEGINITLTDTVKRGKVDVVCEGNTLVNLAPSGVALCNDISDYTHNYFDIAMTQHSDCIEFTTKSEGYLIVGYDNRNNNMLKHNSKYIAMWDVEVVKISGDYIYVGCGSYESMIPKEQKKLSSGRGIVATTFSTTSKDMTSGNYGWITVRVNSDNEPVGNSFKAYGCVLLELSDEEYEKPIDYLINKYYKKFEGVKSAFELEDNKVEILSYKDYITGTLGVYDAQRKPIFYFGYNTIIGSEFELYKKYFNNCGSFDNCNNLFDYYSATDSYWVYLGVWGKTPNDLEKARTVINKYIAECEGGKNEIQLSEPLRGLSNEVCDKFVKQGGKWYVERNCGEKFIDGSDVAYTNVEIYPSDNAHCILTSKLNNLKTTSIVCDKLPTYSVGDSIWMKENLGDKNGVSTVSDAWGFAVRLLNSLTGANKADDKETVISKFKAYLNNNPITVIYELATPTYEEITDPQVITYLDTTHISTNSTIPCNMQVKNSGYSAIIKPSTQYTVAFDTDKSGEVNIALGDAKTSTTNNVATITTAATLTDDSLTLYGKGIKASNVRLLEGDKTNYIPSYFEGMKSCFEDKEQDNGSYEVEIVSYNENKSNSIQLSLIEPLRAVGDVKDRFVLKDGKLMIERNCAIREYQEGDFELDNTLTDKINTVYVLNETIYEEVSFELQKLILECFENGTLFIDTLIPPTVSVTYSANIPVVSKLNKVNEVTEINTEDIAMTQMAVDFLLMSSLGEEMINFKLKGGTNMSAYFASRIIKGALKYEDVIRKYPNYKEDIDLILISEGYSNLIIEL